jgi:phage-related tail fiber protein
MIDQSSQFYAILTNIGVAKQANADVLGIAWKITQMGVGDANGTDPQPNAGQKTLINEWRRAPLNQLKQDSTNPGVIIAEQVIPADVGGKWIREIGLYDSDGDLVAVANCAPSFKPLLTQGSGRTQVVRMNLIVSNTASIELKIDPSVVLATREFVLSELAKQDFKSSVFACAPGSIVLSGLQTVDGQSVTAGKRVLAPFQTAAKDRGIWIAAAGAWTRATDADISDEVTPGMLVLVEQGTLYGDSAWQLVTDAPITLGVTSLTFEMAWGRTGVTAGTYRSVTVDKLGRVVGATNPTTVAGYGLTDVYTVTQIDSALAQKAPLASPALTGIPKAPTAAASTNTDQIATTAFVQALFTALVGAAPDTLNQINEIAAALGNDANFSTTMMNALALRAPIANPVFTGDPKAPTPALGDNDTSIATTAFVQAALAAFGFGTNTSSATAVTDYNAATVGGVYRGAAGATNAPEATGTYVLLVLPFNSGTTLQIAGRATSSDANNRIYWRTSSGAFTGWKEFGALDSPAFTGTPTAPTPALGDTTTKIATMAALAQAVSAANRGFSGGVVNVNGSRTLLISETGLAFRLTPSAPITITMPSPQPGAGLPYLLRNESNVAITISATGLIYTESGAAANSMVLAPSEYIEIASNVSSWVVNARGKLGEVAKIDSPVFTGDPRAPTQNVGDNDTSIATTAFVQAALAAFGFGTFTPPLSTDLNTAVQGTTFRTTSATANTPITGNLSGITLPYNNGGCLQLASQLGGIGRFYWRTQAAGAWTAWREAAATDSPAFTGTPTTPTPAAGDASKQIVNAEFLRSELARMKSVVRFTASGNWTCPDGVTTVWVSGSGGGGGGASGGGLAQPGAGGGGGGNAGASVIAEPITVVPGTVYAITIGGGGAAGATAASGTAGKNGTTGGVTRFGTLLTLAGGSAGLGGDILSGAGGFAQGLGGGGGSDGGDARGLSSAGDGGSGGGGPFGTAGGGGRAGSGGGGVGRAGSGFGCGGGGGGGGYGTQGTANGGAGSAGLPGVLFLEY